MVRVGDEWFPARALQKCFEGVSFDEWEATARQLRLKYREEAAINERLVSEALEKIIKINASEQRTFGTALHAVTPNGLRRAKEDLFLGLSIEPETDGDDALPQEDDLFGRIIPHVGDPDHGQTPEVKIETTDDDPKFVWRFDDE